MARSMPNPPSPLIPSPAHLGKSAGTCEGRYGGLAVSHLLSLLLPTSVETDARVLPEWAAPDGDGGGGAAVKHEENRDSAVGRRASAAGRRRPQGSGVAPPADGRRRRRGLRGLEVERQIRRTLNARRVGQQW